MTKVTTREKLPRPREELEELAHHYDTHDTSEEMENGECVDPRPMVTTSLRVSTTVLDAIKQEARRLGIRHTTLIRMLLEEHVDQVAKTGRPEQVRTDVSGADLADILERLERIEDKLSA